MELNIDPFLQAWNHAMVIGSIALVFVAIIMYLLHHVKVSLIKSYKAKYDYLSEFEIKNYKRVFLVIGGSFFMLANLYGMSDIDEMGVWFFVRLFIGVAVATLVYYVSALILDYYYPKVLDKKLKRLRYTPRINPETGGRMRLLSEDEEDVHLDEGMKAEENVFSVDYDVWIDEKTGKTIIEKYPGRLQALQCGSCGFYTMKIVREEIIKNASATEDGELIKHYQCSYCKSVRATAFNIARKKNYANLSPEEIKFNEEKNVALVKIEIHTIYGDNEHFEFQNLNEASKFIKEYKSNKVK
ncbi:MAG TPA: hypothetical protein PKC24_01815 [Cyclobacteriaceae bacterium]|nr:hypothetical protein [Cyclobacteriaceae bacterium]